MANTKKTPSSTVGRRSREQWSAEVVRWRRSGLGSAEYAAERGLKRGTLLWWSCKIGKTLERAEMPVPGASVSFLPLRVRQAQRDEGAVSGNASAIEVVLCNGRRVRVAGSVDTFLLTQVIAAAEGGVAC